MMTIPETTARLWRGNAKAAGKIKSVRRWKFTKYGDGFDFRTLRFDGQPVN